MVRREADREGQQQLQCASAGGLDAAEGATAADGASAAQAPASAVSAAHVHEPTSHPAARSRR